MVLNQNELLEKLKEFGIESQTIEHEPLHTVAESQAFRGEIPGGHSKNLFLKCKKGQFWLVTALEDTKVELNKLSKLIGSGRLSFGKPDMMMEYLGVTPGSVTPFSVINDKAHKVQVILEKAMLEVSPLNFHPLINTATTSIQPKDLLHFLENTGHTPQIIDFNCMNLANS